MVLSRAVSLPFLCWDWCTEGSKAAFRDWDVCPGNTLDPGSLPLANSVFHCRAVSLKVNGGKCGI